MIKKKDGSTEPWDISKIIEASQKAASRANEPLDTEALTRAILKQGVKIEDPAVIPTSVIHSFVIKVLRDVNPRIADAYQEFRDYKNTYAREFEKIKNLADGVLLLGDRENANFDSSLVSTKGSLIKGYLTKSLYNQFYLSKAEKALTKRGDIYIHDLRDMLLNCFNCCLFDMGNVLKGGFTMSNIKYTEPNSVLSALQVIGDITLVATAQQFGGFTIPEIDKVLIPYCYKTYLKARREWSSIRGYGDIDCMSEDYGLNSVKRELEQGFQSLELKLNTVPCSRGDFAFTTITFGHIDVNDFTDTIRDPVFPDDKDKSINLLSKLYYMINETILETRMKGHGGKQVIFPKLVYLYDGDEIERAKRRLEHLKSWNTSTTTKEHDTLELFKLAVKCSSKCMYPDYLSLTGDPEHNVVAKVYLDSDRKAITSPMGCRAFLSPWRDPKTGKYVTVGRCNIGAVSLNLPLIMAVAKDEAKEMGCDWHSHFWDLLVDRLEVTRNFLKKRYDTLKKVKASTNPMCFMQGGLYNGNLKADDTIESLIPYMTASFGITALNEASILFTGKSIAEDQTFAVKVLRFIGDKVEEFKKEDGYLYALYGTPAESLSSTQAQQYARYSGDNQFGEYFSNSFHCHVSEPINPAQKQDKEYYCFHLCNGGHIQYVRIDNPKNLLALEKIIERGMDAGFYQGVNFDSAYCEDCHKHSTNVLNKCPHCGSTNIVVISRVCGYLGYSNINGATRMNDGKLAEIRDRVSM